MSAMNQEPRYLAELMLLRAAVKRDGNEDAIAALAGIEQLLGAFLVRNAEFVQLGDRGDNGAHPPSYCNNCKRNDNRLCAGHLAHYVRWGTSCAVGPHGPTTP